MKAKILFVEDERDLSLIVCDTLRQQGYEVAAAFDGIGGLAEYRAAGADLVVADVMMPRMDGFAMAKEIRRTSPDVPIIFLTAKSTMTMSNKVLTSAPTIISRNRLNSASCWSA